MTDLMRLVDDHANLWRRVGAHAPWPAVDQEKLLGEARALSKELKAECERMRAENEYLGKLAYFWERAHSNHCTTDYCDVSDVAPLRPADDLEAFRNHSMPEKVRP